MTAPAIPSSRRVSAGIVPDPGATSRLPAWWGDRDWLEELADALQERPELLRDHHVSRDAVLKLADKMAAHADWRTGRDCRPTNERLVELCQCSLSTVQRARRVLKALGMVVELIGGRSIMTRSERLEAWRRGSSHRQVAAVFALCSRRRRAPKSQPPKVSDPVDNRGACGTSVERDTPPGAPVVQRVTHLRGLTLRRQTENEDRRSAPSSYRSRRPDRVGGVHPGTERLSQTVRTRLPWLRGTSWRRLAPTLSRFARAGWGARDVELAVRDVLTRRGWRIPPELQQPAAYLAGLLRELDPADRPGAAEEFMRRTEAAENRYRLQLAAGAPCPHGMPAGHVPSPLRGLKACPLCRKDDDR